MQNGETGIRHVAQSNILCAVQGLFYTYQASLCCAVGCCWPLIAVVCLRIHRYGFQGRLTVFTLYMRGLLHLFSCGCSLHHPSDLQGTRRRSFSASAPILTGPIHHPTEGVRAKTGWITSALIKHSSYPVDFSHNSLTQVFVGYRRACLRRP